MGKNRNLFLIPRRLKYKLRIAFYLMSILPLLVCVYFISNYILPKADFKPYLIAPVIISIFIALVGFFVIKEIFERIQTLSREAKLIAAGDIARHLDIEREDEIGDLAKALNQLTQFIRNDMDELKIYGERTNQINLEIQKRIFLFSNLLQISSLISQGKKIEDILKTVVEKSRLLDNSEAAYLLFRNEGEEDFYMRAADGINSEHLLEIKIAPGQSVFNNLIRTDAPLVLDAENVFAPQDVYRTFCEKFKLKNTLALPVHLKGRVTAILGIGNTHEPFSYKKDDIELLDIFSKQIAIALENNILMGKVEKLEIKDALTGLYNERFIHTRLQEEIKRAIIYRRSCAFIIINIDNFKAFHQQFGSLEAEATLKKAGVLIKDSVAEIDFVGRTADNEFAIILPEKNKRQAQEIAEGIRERIESIFGREQNNKKLTVSGGVSENPLDGLTAEELMRKAEQALKIAKTQGKNRIIS